MVDYQSPNGESGAGREIDRPRVADRLNTRSGEVPNWMMAWTIALVGLLAGGGLVLWGTLFVAACFR